MKYVIIVLALLVVGCESEADRRAQRAANQARNDANDHATCVDYGLERGQPGYADCRLRLSQMRAQNQAARNAAALQWWGMQQQQQQQRQPTQTNCRWVLGQMQCTTY